MKALVAGNDDLRCLRLGAGLNSGSPGSWPKSSLRALLVADHRVSAGYIGEALTDR